MSKYGNRKTEVFGFLFDSRREAERYLILRSQLDEGLISDLCLQVKYACDVNGRHICNYFADFAYLDQFGHLVIEDSKGVRTKEYRIKKKLVEAIPSKLWRSNNEHATYLSRA